jgi:hypothetical protein
MIRIRIATGGSFMLRILACLLVFAAARASASTVVAMTLDQMSERAESIFLGRVTGTRADWNAERTRIYTYVTLEVDRYLKGGSESKVATVRFLGGRVGPYAAMVPGSPRFEVGEEVLLFCAGGGARIPTVLGMSLGKFTIVADPSGERVLRRDISGLMLANHRTDARKPGDPITRYRLAEVEARIQEAIR